MSIKEILKSILDELKHANDKLPDDRLWTVQDCAKYWQIHPNNALKILKQPGAPKNVSITRQGRYKPDDIKNFKVK